MGPLRTAIDGKLTSLFCSGHISTYIDKIFWGFTRKSYPKKNISTLYFPYAEILIPYTYFQKLLNRKRLSLESENILHLKSDYIHFRYFIILYFIF